MLLRQGQGHQSNIEGTASKESLDCKWPKQALAQQLHQLQRDSDVGVTDLEQARIYVSLCHKHCQQCQPTGNTGQCERGEEGRDS